MQSEMFPASWDLFRMRSSTPVSYFRLNADPFQILIMYPIPADASVLMLSPTFIPILMNGPVYVPSGQYLNEMPPV